MTPAIDQNWNGYAPAEHRIWDKLYQRQHTLLASRACDALLKTMLQQLPRYTNLAVNSPRGEAVCSATPVQAGTPGGRR